MKRYGAILGGAVVLVIVGFAVGSSAISGGPDDGGRRLATVSSGINEMVDAAIAVTAADPTESVYFFPQESDTTVTILFLANTNNTNVEVSGWAYSKDGAVLVSVCYLLAPGQMKTIASNAFWGYNGSVWDLGPNTTYAKLALPRGVVVEGYVAWSSTSVYDSDVAVYTRPLRFTSVPVQ